MAPKVTYTSEEQNVLAAVQNANFSYDDKLAQTYITSNESNACLIHALLGVPTHRQYTDAAGTTSTREEYYAANHLQIRKFLGEFIKSFSDAEIAQGEDKVENISNPKFKFLNFMYTLVLAEGSLNQFKAALSTDQDIRYLTSAEIRLLAVLMNAYVINWTINNNAMNSHTMSFYAPDPNFREAIIARAKAQKIEIPQELLDCEKRPFRAIHIENSNNDHFSRVKWVAGTQILFPTIHAATTMLNTKFGLTPELDDLVQPQITKPVPPGSGGSSSGSATQKPLTFVTRAPANLSDPTHYHVKGLGEIKDIVEWVNHGLIKQNHKFKSGETEYRLFLKQDPIHKDRYQMFKCEVDKDGNYKVGAKAKPITPVEEKGWASSIETLFKAYAKQKNETPTFTGFNL